jgi:hypothetical protein
MLLDTKLVNNAAWFPTELTAKMAALDRVLGLFVSTGSAKELEHELWSKLYSLSWMIPQ